MQNTTRRAGGRHSAGAPADDRPDDGRWSVSSGRRALTPEAVDAGSETTINDTVGSDPVGTETIVEDSFGTRRAVRAAERSDGPADNPPLQLESKAPAPRPQRPLAVKPSGTVERASRTRRTKESARRFTAFTASTASVGLAMSLMFALPADAAQPSTLSASAIHTIVDNNGHTAAQILDVSGNVTMPALQRDNQIAAALTGIVSQEGGADAGTAQAAISYALQYGGSRTAIVETALSYLGDPYVLGGSSHSGIDCSGLVMVAYAAVGIHLGHLVSDEDGVATPITEAQALPGDIVVFNDEQHIGIYLGNGLLIQAPEPGTPVNIVPVWSIPHHFARILPAGD